MEKTAREFVCGDNKRDKHIILNKYNIFFVVYDAGVLLTSDSQATGTYFISHLTYMIHMTFLLFVYHARAGINDFDTAPHIHGCVCGAPKCHCTCSEDRARARYLDQWNMVER